MLKVRSGLRLTRRVIMMLGVGDVIFCFLGGLVVDGMFLRVCMGKMVLFSVVARVGFGSGRDVMFCLTSGVSTFLYFSTTE